MSESRVQKSGLNPVKVVVLLVIWAASSVLLQLLTESQWWLCTIGGAGVVVLALSFILPAAPAPGAAELDAAPSKPADSPPPGGP